MIFKNIYFLFVIFNFQANVALTSTIENTEEEKHRLLNKVKHLEAELKEISEKYADLAGHHNNKQKIKHLTDLKRKNEELSEVSQY